MIAIVFLLGLLGVTIFAAATTGQALPIPEILMLVAVFLVFFGSGVYIAAVLGALGVLTGFMFSDRPGGPSSARRSGRRRRTSCSSPCRCFS